MHPDAIVVESVGVDRRREQRHDVERPCRVTPAAAPQAEMDGITANVSRSGVLVRFPAPDVSLALPQEGEFVRILIDLPASKNFSPRSLECTGRVVRTAAEGREDPVVAFEIHNMKIRTRRTPARQRRPKAVDLVQ